MARQGARSCTPMHAHAHRGLPWHIDTPQAGAALQPLPPHLQLHPQFLPQPLQLQDHHQQQEWGAALGRGDTPMEDLLPADLDLALPDQNELEDAVTSDLLQGLLQSRASPLLSPPASPLQLGEQQQQGHWLAQPHGGLQLPMSMALEGAQHAPPAAVAAAWEHQHLLAPGTNPWEPNAAGQGLLLEGEGLCIMCLDAPRHTTLAPCGHRCDAATAAHAAATAPATAAAGSLPWAAPP